MADKKSAGVCNSDWVWEWKCHWCNARGASRTKRYAKESQRAHELAHIVRAREQLVAEGFLEPCGERDGKSIYRATVRQVVPSPGSKN